MKLLLRIPQHLILYGGMFLLSWGVTSCEPGGIETATNVPMSSSVLGVEPGITSSSPSEVPLSSSCSSSSSSSSTPTLPLSLTSTSSSSSSSTPTLPLLSLTSRSSSSISSTPTLPLLSLTSSSSTPTLPLSLTSSSSRNLYSYDDGSFVLSPADKNISQARESIELARERMVGYEKTKTVEDAVAAEGQACIAIKNIKEARWQVELSLRSLLLDTEGQLDAVEATVAAAIAAAPDPLATPESISITLAAQLDAIEAVLQAVRALEAVTYIVGLGLPGHLAEALAIKGQAEQVRGSSSSSSSSSNEVIVLHEFVKSNIGQALVLLERAEKALEQSITTGPLLTAFDLLAVVISKGSSISPDYEIIRDIERNRASIPHRTCTIAHLRGTSLIVSSVRDRAKSAKESFQKVAAQVGISTIPASVPQKDDLRRDGCAIQ